MRIRILFLMTTFFIASCQTTPEMQTIRIALDWTPNTNHTGLYVAKTKQYFKERDINVVFLPVGDMTPEALVASKKADIGISYQENLTFARTNGLKLISIAAVMQHNTSGFASLQKNQILRPKDFVQKRYGGWGSPSEKAILSALMISDHVDPNLVTYVHTGNADFFTNLKNGIDLGWIYYGWTGIEASLKNIPLNMIYMKDYDTRLDFYTPILITHEDHVIQKQDIIKRFMKGATKGYTFAIQHPEEAAEILSMNAPELNKKLVLESQKWMALHYQATAPIWGVQELNRWQGYADWMKENNLLSQDFDASKAFTNQFVLQEQPS